MNNNIRVFLWLGLALAVWVNYSRWQMDYAPKPAPIAADGTSEAPKTPDLRDTVPQAVQSASEAPAPGPAPVPAAAAATTAVEQPGNKIRVTTDVLVFDISLKGGDLVRAELPAYPVVKGQPEPVVLFNTDSAATNYVMQTGLTSAKPGERPTHLAVFSTTADKFELAPGQDELRVPMSWTDGNGVTVTKTYVFKRGYYGIGLEYAIQNNSAAPWEAASYAQIFRADPPVERSMFNYKPESFAFRGPSMWDGSKYSKLAIKDAKNQNFAASVKNGWIAGMQHHFVTAVVPNPASAYNFTLRAQGSQFLFAAVGPAHTVAPGATLTLSEKLFVGPKLQKQLVMLNPELDRVADYTWLTLIAKPLFWLLDKAHSLVTNWGLSIILVTFLLKLMFYPLAQYSGRQIARMRTLTPRMKQLQETYKDDREKLGRAMMELYKSEKANPLSGCLPMLIQMPVFIAFYWVLLESVEMRQAPFFGWINDLSARDPYFILPALNGVAMWIQYKLNPPPPDPVQAKVFQFMPLVMSAMFALFPAGLVLYWVTNTGLSILQQWNINRTLAAEDKARKK